MVSSAENFFKLSSHVWSEPKKKKNKKSTTTKCILSCVRLHPHMENRSTKNLWQRLHARSTTTHTAELQKHAVRGRGRQGGTHTNTHTRVHTHARTRRGRLVAQEVLVLLTLSLSSKLSLQKTSPEVKERLSDSLTLNINNFRRNDAVDWCSKVNSNHCHHLTFLDIHFMPAILLFLYILG